MNNNDAAYKAGIKATDIGLKISICDNHTEEFEDPNIWDGYESF